MFRDAHTDRAPSWRPYLEAFHHQRAGVTERVLGHCVDQAGVNPHQWVAETVEPDAVVLDLACGSGPFHDLTTGPWVGMDVSSAELDQATVRGASPLVPGDAANLPFAAASFDAVVCSMALMLAQPLENVLRETTRVLRPSGQLVALLPTTRPLELGDRRRYGRLLLALRRRRSPTPTTSCSQTSPVCSSELGSPSSRIDSDASPIGSRRPTLHSNSSRRYTCPA
ncbi:MAG: class I SAM-dependent methyltransferase [Acidimicrobiia bacterium]